ncbi:sensor histidine kinase [Streptomyces humidus]|nr:histidine kinase [Streptomyces humidus]
MTSPPPVTWTSGLEPEVLIGRSRLGDAEYRSVVRLLTWLGRVTQAGEARPWVWRWAVPLGCALLGIKSVVNAPDGSGPDWAAMLVVNLAVTIPLLWRARWPLPVFAFLTLVLTLDNLLHIQTEASFGLVAVLYNVGRFGTLTEAAVVAGVTVTQTIVTAVWAAPGSGVFNGLAVDRGLWPAVVAVTAVTALGLTGKLVQAYIAALQEYAAHLQVERDQRAKLAAAQERARVAREMHDILGHTLAVIVGLAGSAAGLAEAKPQRGAETLRIIADSGRGALAELRRLLSVIGDEGEATTDKPLAPQPGLSDLEPLLDRVRAAGPIVTLHAEGELDHLAGGLQLAVYRIVQEALTNTLKHSAADTTVHVTLAADDAIHVTVKDTGPPRTPGTGGQSYDGRGLLGMRERAALYGGTVTTGPNADGGWTVHARLVPDTPTASMESHPA